MLGIVFWVVPVQAARVITFSAFIDNSKVISTFQKEYVIYGIALCRLFWLSLPLFLKLGGPSLHACL